VPPDDNLESMLINATIPVPGTDIQLPYFAVGQVQDTGQKILKTFFWKFLDIFCKFFEQFIVTVLHGIFDTKPKTVYKSPKFLTISENRKINK